MAFATKTDPFGLSTAANSPLEIISVTDNTSAQLTEAHDQSGAVVAHEVYGETIAPSADYKIDAQGSIAITLGTVGTYKTKKVMLGNVSISTSAGGEPSVSASGEQVEDGATTAHKFVADNATIAPWHHAQILFSAFTVGGTGCHLQSANYTISCSIGKTTKEGVCIASDVTDGAIEAQVSIQQTGTAEPTITPGSDWAVTSPLSCSNPDADYPTWTATLKKHLAHTETSA